MHDIPKDVVGIQFRQLVEAEPAHSRGRTLLIGDGRLEPTHGFRVEEFHLIGRRNGQDQNDHLTLTAGLRQHPLERKPLGAIVRVLALAGAPQLGQAAQQIGRGPAVDRFQPGRVHDQATPIGHRGPRLRLYFHLGPNELFEAIPDPARDSTGPPEGGKQDSQIRHRILGNHALAESPAGLALDQVANGVGERDDLGPIIAEKVFVQIVGGDSDDGQLGVRRPRLQRFPFAGGRTGDKPGLHALFKRPAGQLHVEGITQQR